MAFVAYFVIGVILTCVLVFLLTRYTEVLDTKRRADEEFMLVAVSIVTVLLWPFVIPAVAGIPVIYVVYSFAKKGKK